jgi:hypothetical protein
LCSRQPPACSTCGRGAAKLAVCLLHVCVQAAQPFVPLLPNTYM